MAWLSKRGSVYYIKYWSNGRTLKTSTGNSTFQVAKEKLRQFEDAKARGDDFSLPVWWSNFIFRHTFGSQSQSCK